MRLQGTWTDGQGDSYIPPQTLFAGGYNNIQKLKFLTIGTINRNENFERSAQMEKLTHQLNPYRHDTY